MNRRVLGWTCGVVVLLAAALVVGCGRDAGGADRSLGPTAAAARVEDGAVVRATLRDAIAVPRGGAASALVELDPAPAEAVVAHGLAVDGRSGALLAAWTWGVATRQLDFRDEAGHAHRLLVGRAPGAGPVQSVRYEADGEVVAEAVFRWDRVGDGFVLHERVLTLFDHGRLLLQQVRRADGADVLSAAAAAASPAPGGGPRPLFAEMMPFCLKEWAVYIGASAALIVAGELYTVAPNPATASALVAAAGAWDKAFTNLLVCQAS